MARARPPQDRRVSLAPVTRDAAPGRPCGRRLGDLSFADPAALAIDSTVQANIAYPSEAHLLVNMTLWVTKVWMSMKPNVSSVADVMPCVDVKAVKAKARASLFRNRQAPDHAKTKFQELWHEAFAQISPVRTSVDVVLDDDIQRMPWTIRRAWDQVHEHGSTSSSRWRASCVVGWSFQTRPCPSTPGP